MIASSVQQIILEILRQNAGTGIYELRFMPVGGGSINETYRVETNTGQSFFIKQNSNSKFPGLFEAEVAGLDLLEKQKLVRVPQFISNTVVNDTQLLVLEWIEQGMKDAGFWRVFGEQLAALHRVHDGLFGLETDNYMGALVQSNQQRDNWTRFFIHERIEPQLKLAVDSQLLSAQQIRQFEKLYIKLHEIFPVVRPALLHGDLWSGNFLCDEAGMPVLIDPAVYYGHPAVDLAMTTLFGGFSPEFYDSYSYHQPFPPNYREQWEVCNLYPLLIHLNLFGESYRSAILHTIRRY